MKAQNRVHTETTVHSDGSVTTIIITKSITKDSAEVIITTRNRSGMAFTTKETMVQHTEHST
ncbi:MAG: hypothetical protein IJ906_12185 [Oscillospiraceae bacterium]|nr:hypothetical protein [Oscillospiraceae bacterium]